MKTRMLGRFLMAAALLAGAAAASTKGSTKPASKRFRNRRERAARSLDVPPLQHLGRPQLPRGRRQRQPDGRGETSPIRSRISSAWFRKSRAWPASPTTSRCCRCPPWTTGCVCRWRAPSTATPCCRAMRWGRFPAIHIIVENGHVTLTGMVNSDHGEADRRNARGIRLEFRTHHQ